MLEDARGPIDYNEEGSGPTILFVPGSWATRSAWRGVIAALDGRFRVVTTSLLGYGGTQERRTATDASIERQAEIIEAVVQRAGGPVHLVGHSYGGLVCLAVAIRGIASLASLTAIEPVVFSLLRQAGDLPLHQQYITMREGYFQAFEGGDKEAARRVVDYLSGDGGFDALPSRMRDYIVATTPTHILDMRSGLDFDPPLSAFAGLSMPSLVISGERGLPSLRRSAEILSSAVPNASLVTVPGASHFMMATHPEVVARLVGDHVSKVETPG
jgi:pimeloyl-ACP methyl ester carboxylesterase